MATQKTQTAPPPTASVKTVTVMAQTPITYDGKAVAPGEVFDVREADLGQLLSVKAVTVDPS